MCIDNYYDVVGFCDSIKYDDNIEDVTFTVNWNGVDYPNCRCVIDTLQADWDDMTYVYETRVSMRVPVGYDGMIWGAYDGGIDWPDDKYIYEIADENTMFMRLK